MVISDPKSVVLFGAGKTLDSYLCILERCFDIKYICDNDRSKHGEYIIGTNKQYLIKGFEDLIKEPDSEVWIVSLHWKEIARQLWGGGINNVHTVFSDYPIDSEYQHSKILYEKLWEKQKEKIGDRKDFDWIKRTWEIYEEWNNHFKPNYYLGIAENYGILKDGFSVLDYGFGVGTMVFNGLLQGYDIYGVEIEPWKYDFVIQKNSELKYPTEWIDRFILYEGDQIPFEDEKFDLVLSWFVMEHVKSIRDSLSEMLRVVKRGGYLMFDCPNYNSGYDDHYYLDIGKSLHDNYDELKKAVEAYNGDTAMIDEINFINSDDVMSALDLFEGIEVRYQYLDLSPSRKKQNMRFLIKKVQ